MQYAGFIWSLIILGAWFIMYLARKKGVRKEMLTVSIGTTPLVLTEPLLIPEYRNPPSLLNLAQEIGFNIESFIFSFAIGGIGFVIYKIFTKTKLQSTSNTEKLLKAHLFHRYTLLVPVANFLLLSFFTNLNHIYCAVVSMFTGALTALWFRPSLEKKIRIGGIIFFLMYFFYFTSLRLVLPNYVDSVWNIEEITGLIAVGIPLEEYLFAFTFGMFWSSFYEYTHCHKLIKTRKILQDE